MSVYPSRPDIPAGSWDIALVPIVDFLQERSHWAQLPAPFEYNKSEGSTGSYRRRMHALGQGISSTKSVALTLGGKRMSWHYRLTAFARSPASTTSSTTGAMPAWADEIAHTSAAPRRPSSETRTDLSDNTSKAASATAVNPDVDCMPCPDYYTRL